MEVQFPKTHLDTKLCLYSFLGFLYTNTKHRWVQSEFEYKPINRAKEIRNLQNKRPQEIQNKNTFQANLISVSFSLHMLFIPEV